MESHRYPHAQRPLDLPRLSTFGNQLRTRDCCRYPGCTGVHNLSGGCPFYPTWRGIKQRCLNPDDPHYRNYGGRGIKLYEPWVNDYRAFARYVVETIGSRPEEGMSLDRINNDGNYEPGNLRWATAKMQANNRRPRERWGEMAA